MYGKVHSQCECTIAQCSSTRQIRAKRALTHACSEGRTLSADDIGHMCRAGNGDALGDILRLLWRAGQQRAGVTAVEVAERRLLAARARVRRCGVVPANVDIQHRELERRLQRLASLHAVNLICCHFVEDWRGERGGARWCNLGVVFRKEDETDLKRLFILRGPAARFTLACGSNVGRPAEPLLHASHSCTLHRPFLRGAKNGLAGPEEVRHTHVICFNWFFWGCGRRESHRNV